jgi:hypothetical protein
MAIAALSAAADTRTSPLSRGLADALYAKLAGGSTIGGTTVFNNVTINGTCIGCSTGSVPTTRTISTTSPLGGGGDLSADRTFTCTTCATSSNNLSFFAATTSLQVLNLVNDETGTGPLVFANAPVLTTPTIADFTNAQHAHTSAATGGSLGAAAIGSGTLATARGGTNSDSSGSTGIPKVAAGVWTYNAGVSNLASSTSADVASILSDETGTLKVVFSDSPSLTTLADISATANPALTFTNSGNSVKTTVQSVSGDAAFSSNARYNGSWNRDNVSNVAWNVTGSVGIDQFIVRRGAAAANPITWANLFVIDGATSVSTFGGAVAFSQTAGLVGTTTNNNANAGAIGEFTNAQCPGPTTTATITVTIASPGVVTWTSHPFSGTAPRFDACPVVFTTTGALPTGITASTTYWVIPTTISGNNFSIATSVANAIAGTAINTSGTQSGTQTGTAGSVLTTATAKDVTGLALTAGDWDCSASLVRNLGATTSVTLLKSSISTTSATDGTLPAGTMDQLATAANVMANDVSRSVTTRMLNSATTSTFLVADDTFTVSTNKAYGTIRCRRMR